LDFKSPLSVATSRPNKKSQQNQARSRLLSESYGKSSAFAFAAEFFQQLDLDLLDLEQPVVLAAQQMVDFFRANAGSQVPLSD
jgi:hypothetical protein